MLQVRVFCGEEEERAVMLVDRRVAIGDHVEKIRGATRSRRHSENVETLDAKVPLVLTVGIEALVVDELFENATKLRCPPVHLEEEGGTRAVRFAEDEEAV